MTERSHSHSEPGEVENNRYSGIRVKTFLFVGQLEERALQLKSNAPFVKVEAIPV